MNRNLDTPMMFLATKDARRARAFYEGALGLLLESDEPYALVFSIGKVMLRIQKVEEVTAPGYTSLGWKVEDIQAVAKDLLAKGVTFEDYAGLDQDENGIWKSPSGARVAWFKDPDGHVLSLTQI